MNNGAIAVVGIVCEAIIIGYNAFSALGNASIRTARSTPKTIDIARPISVTPIVAGR